MMLPNADTALVDDLKLRDYLLSRTHPAGRCKARSFAAIDFTPDTTAELAAELVRIATDRCVRERVLTIYGTKYVIDGDIVGPAGRARVRTIWFQAGAGSPPRLITACVLGAVA
jgi:hypothetical protein